MQQQDPCCYIDQDYANHQHELSCAMSIALHCGITHRLKIFCLQWYHNSYKPHLMWIPIEFLTPVFLRCFREPIRVPRIENRVPRIRENHHRVPRIKENRVPRIREIGSLQVHMGYLTFSLKKPALCKIYKHTRLAKLHLLNVSRRGICEDMT